jgi:hypothetical protein
LVVMIRVCPSTLRVNNVRFCFLAFRWQEFKDFDSLLKFNEMQRPNSRNQTPWWTMCHSCAEIRSELMIQGHEYSSYFETNDWLAITANCQSRDSGERRGRAESGRGVLNAVVLTNRAPTVLRVVEKGIPQVGLSMAVRDAK